MQKSRYKWEKSFIVNMICWYHNFCVWNLRYCSKPPWTRIKAEKFPKTIQWLAMLLSKNFKKDKSINNSIMYNDVWSSTDVGTLRLILLPVVCDLKIQCNGWCCFSFQQMKRISVTVCMWIYSYVLTEIIWQCILKIILF